MTFTFTILELAAMGVFIFFTGFVQGIRAERWATRPTMKVLR